MTQVIRERFLHSKSNPKKWKTADWASHLLTDLRARLRKSGTISSEAELLSPPIEKEYVSLLVDVDFQRSVAEARDHTCLDLVRLANLWTSVKMAGRGLFLEVGSYRGGTALHICNAMEHAGSYFYSFDPFEAGGFENLTDCDRAFRPTDFTDTNFEAVTRLLSSKPFAKVVPRYSSRFGSRYEPR